MSYVKIRGVQDPALSCENRTDNTQGQQKFLGKTVLVITYYVELPNERLEIGMLEILGQYL